MMDAGSSIQPSTSTIDEKQGEARTLNLIERQTAMEEIRTIIAQKMTMEEIVSQIGTSDGFTYSLGHNNLGYHKVSTRWTLI